MNHDAVNLIFQKLDRSYRLRWLSVVIRILFKQALDEKSFRDGRRITLNEVSEETGISRPTLTRISNVPGVL